MMLCAGHLTYLERLMSHSTCYPGARLSSILSGRSCKYYPFCKLYFFIKLSLWRIGELGRQKGGWEYTKHPSCQEQKQNL